MKKYWVNVRQTALQPRKKTEEFTNGEVSATPSTRVEYHPCEKLKIAQNRKSYMLKILMLLSNIIKHVHFKEQKTQDKPMTTVPDLTHETSGGVKLVHWDPNPHPTSGQRKNIAETDELTEEITINILKNLYMQKEDTSLMNGRSY